MRNDSSWPKAFAWGLLFAFILGLGAGALAQVLGPALGFALVGAIMIAESIRAGRRNSLADCIVFATAATAAAAGITAMEMFGFRHEQWRTMAMVTAHCSLFPALFGFAADGSDDYGNPRIFTCRAMLHGLVATTIAAAIGIGVNRMFGNGIRQVLNEPIANLSPDAQLGVLYMVVLWSAVGGAMGGTVNRLDGGRAGLATLATSFTAICAGSVLTLRQYFFL